MGESENLPAVVVPQESAQLATRDVVAQVESIQRVMKAVMKVDTHYGRIPGCGDKQVLFKAGAEKLCLTFRLTPTYESECIDLPDGHREYKFRCRLTHGPSGAFVAEGVGSCSTMESKYRYRKGSGILCPSCDQPLRKSEREWYCWDKKGGCGAKYALDDDDITGQTPGRLENPDIADQYNTVLKMSKKRSYVDATITATSASDIFTQDIGDPEKDDAPRAERPGPREDPRAREVDDFVNRQVEPVRPAGDDQWKKLEARLHELGITHDDEILTMAEVNGIKRQSLNDLTPADLSVMEKAVTKLEETEDRRSGARSE